MNKRITRNGSAKRVNTLDTVEVEVITGHCILNCHGKRSGVCHEKGRAVQEEKNSELPSTSGAHIHDYLKEECDILFP